MSQSTKMKTKHPMRRMVPNWRNGGVVQAWACNSCAWEMKLPTVGAYGHGSHKAKLAQVRMAYAKHDCDRHRVREE